MVLGFNSTRTFDSSTEMGWVLTHRDPDLGEIGPHFVPVHCGRHYVGYVG